MSSFATGLIIAFTASWKITLITLGVSPFLICSGKIRSNMRTGFSAKTDAAYKDSGNLVTETVTNIRTVFSFGNKPIMLKTMDKKLEEPAKIIAK